MAWQHRAPHLSEQTVPVFLPRTTKPVPLASFSLAAATHSCTGRTVVLLSLGAGRLLKRRLIW